MPDPAPLLPAFEPGSLVGTTLDGRYDLVEHLASGGMGAVFRARHVHLRKDVAVKVLRHDLTWSAEIVERFRREAEIASALEHDNIVRVTDFGRTPEGSLFLAMDLLSGESLFDRLRREGFLAPEEAVPILWQICAGLEAAHALGVVHRDLKPENVFLARTATGREVAKLLDFGIAKLADPAGGGTQAGIVVGTPEYLSPEQAMGTAVDGRADVYAVGLIAWRALAGRHPFKAEDSRALLMMQATQPVPPLTEPRPDLASYPGLVAAVARACAKDAAERQQTAAGLREELAAALGPAFMMPPGATPAPSLPAIPPAAHAELPTPVLSPPRASASFVRALEGTGPRGVARRTGARARAAWTRAARLVRAKPLLAAALAAAALLATATVAAVAWQRGRAATEARALLAAERAAEARAVLDAALERRPADPELLLLMGRTLHRLPGRTADGIEAYAAARQHVPLDEAAREDLVRDLGRERSVADRAARLLREEGDLALAAVLPAAEGAKGVHRLRALTVARDLGAELHVDRARAYGELLEDSDCDVRRAAARRLGEIGDAAALQRLRKAALATTGTKGFFGTKTAPACGAPEADAAARRIEAAHRP